MLLGSLKLAPANRSLEVHYIQSPNIKKFRLHVSMHGRVGPDTVIKGRNQPFIWKVRFLYHTYVLQILIEPFYEDNYLHHQMNDPGLHSLTRMIMYWNT